MKPQREGDSLMLKHKIGKKQFFQEGFNYFIENIEKYNLVPINKKDIYIYYSGGKDASLLIDFFIEYKKRFRPELEITLLTIDFPKMIYRSKDKRQQKFVKDAFNYWKGRGIQIKIIHVSPDITDAEFNELTFPCKLCEKIKIEAMNREMDLEEYNGSLVCLGHTLDDIIGSLSEIFYCCGKSKSWRDIKENNKELFARLISIARWVYLTYSPQRTKATFTYIKPLMFFEEHVIREIVNERKYPLIPECCQDFGGEKFQLYKRVVNKEIEMLKRQYSDNSAIYNNLLFRDYSSILNVFNRLELLPPLEFIEEYEV